MFTVDTTSMNTLPVDSYSITSIDLQEFTGYANVHTIGTIGMDTEVHTLDSKVNTKRQTPATIAIEDYIGTIKSRKFLKVLFDSRSMCILITTSALPQGVQGKSLNGRNGINTLSG